MFFDEGRDYFANPSLTFLGERGAWRIPFDVVRDKKQALPDCLGRQSHPRGLGVRGAVGGFPQLVQERET